MLDYILPFLIFLSLGVIIYIIGKHLPELRKISRENFNNRNDDDNDKKAVDKFKKFFYKLGAGLKNGFFCLIEIIIKKIKQFLHLVHFWVLKTKKGSSEGDDLSRENEVKKELIASEEQSLERIIEDDLDEDIEINIKKDIFVDKKADTEEEIIRDNNDDEKKEDKKIDINNEKRGVEEERQVVEDDEIETSSKIESFFFDEKKEDEIEEDEDFQEIEKESSSVFSRILSNFKNRLKSSKSKKENEIDNENIGDEEDVLFLDGIVNVSDSNYGGSNVDEGALIKEVVKVSKKEIDIDDEIGVDRSILEKKIVQKIAKNPKDMENYRELGELYIKMKNFSDAEECYKQILRVHLRDVDAKRKMEKIKLLKRMG